MPEKVTVWWRRKGARIVDYERRGIKLDEAIETVDDDQIATTHLAERLGCDRKRISSCLDARKHKLPRPIVMVITEDDEWDDDSMEDWQASTWEPQVQV